jgi:uncharacterized membrane protein (DUF106 family)
MATPEPADDRPLAETAPAPAEPEAPEPESEAAAAPPVRPPPPAFKATTFLYTFLFVLGILMLFDTSTRNSVALELGVVLQPAIGFGGSYVLLTMFLAAVIEMVLTALAYNWATDWFKTARVQQWGAALRKVQMEALRSGKKDRVDALKPHQQRFTQLSSEVSMAQLKGMAVTWFLVIAIYTWVGLFLCQTGGGALHNGSCGGSNVPVTLAGATINLMSQPGWPLPPWFVLFSLYTVPMSLLFRRLLKHYSLRQHASRAAAASAAGPELPGGAA